MLTKYGTVLEILRQQNPFSSLILLVYEHIWKFKDIPTILFEWRVDWSFIRDLQVFKLLYRRNYSTKTSFVTCRFHWRYIDTVTIWDGRPRYSKEIHDSHCFSDTYIFRATIGRFPIGIKSIWIRSKIDL